MREIGVFGRKWCMNSHFSKLADHVVLHFDFKGWNVYNRPFFVYCLLLPNSVRHFQLFRDRLGVKAVHFAWHDNRVDDFVVVTARFKWQVDDLHGSVVVDVKWEFLGFEPF